jgi:hypothetical protein
MTRYSAPLFIAATMYFITLPTPTLAHGLPSPWPEGLVTIAAMAVTKAAVLSWRFGEPLSRRTIGLLFLSTLAGMCVAAAISVLLAYATTG